MSNELTIINQDSKAVLAKARNLINITNKILANKSSNEIAKSFLYKPFLIEHGHSSWIKSIAITPDGKHIVSGSKDKTIKIWNTQSGECLKTLEGHSNIVTSVAITPDGKYIVSGSKDSTIKIWDIRSGDCLNTLEGHSAWVLSVAITPNGEHIASGSDDKTIKIWDRESGECLKTLDGNSKYLISIAITSDGRYIVSEDCGYDYIYDEYIYGEVKIWDMKSGECLNTLEGHSRFIDSIAITRDGKHIVSGSSDNTIKIWDFKSGECLKTLHGHSNSVTSVAITPDGKHIVSGSYDKTIKIWDMRSGECLKTLKGHSNYVNSIAITPDGKHIVSGSEDGTIKIWNNESCECIYTIDHNYDIVIDNNGYFMASDEAIDKYIRVSEAPLSQRKLTDDEIKHFRKKGDFLQIGEPLPKPKVEPIEIVPDNNHYTSPLPNIIINDDDIPF